MALITAAQVVEISFTHQSFDTTLIKAAYITMAELDFIKPVLGEDLFNVIAADPSALDSKNLILYSTYLKPAMAYYVKYLTLPDMFLNTTTSGLQINNREFSNSGAAKDRAELAQATLSVARSFIENAIKYIEHEDNIDYFTTYTTSDETKATNRIIGGIVFE